MKLRHYLRLATACLAVVFVGLLFSLAVPSAGYAQMIAGQVLDDATSAGIDGATVTFTNTNGVTATTTTGGGGYFMDTLASGTYQVKASLLPDYPQVLWPGMFDSSSGTYITHVVVPPGNFSVYIYLHHNTSATLTGTVTDAVSSDPIVGAQVIGTATSGGIDWSTTTDGSGAYSVHADAGNFNVVAQMWGYTTSTPVAVVLATGANTQDMSLSPLPTFAISGNVTGNPGGNIAGATVSINCSFTTDSAGHNLDAVTDAAGHYSIDVPEGSNNIVSASATGFIAQTHSGTVVASADQTVDFILLPTAADPTRMSGKILDCGGSGLAAKGTVYAYPVVSGLVVDAPVTMPVDSGNTFTYTGLPAGDYDLWFLPQDNTRFTPDYYSSPSCTGNWANATTITLAISQQLAGRDIRIQQVAIPSGPYSVFGTITVLIPSITEVPLDSVRVYARDSVGTLIAFATTDAQGNFTIANLPKATYHLSVDRIGYNVKIRDSVVHLTSTSPDSLAVKADVKMLKQGTTGIVDSPTDLPAALALHENYPNPFVGSTTVSFSTNHSGSVVIDVRDVLGRIVSTVVNGTLPQGEHIVEFNAANLPAGVYFTRLASAGRAVVKTMVVKR